MLSLVVLEDKILVLVPGLDLEGSALAKYLVFMLFSLFVCMDDLKHYVFLYV